MKSGKILLLYYDQRKDDIILLREKYTHGVGITIQFYLMAQTNFNSPLH